MARTVGKYLLEGVVGGNRFGRVYQAEDTDRAQVFALRVVEFPAAISPIESRLRERFLAEAGVLESLEHPGIARIVDFGEHEDKLYLVTELIEGRSLRQVMRAEAPFPQERALALTRQVLEALGAAHDVGLVHGGLNPDGILVLPDRNGEEQVRILDFGLAWTMRGEALGSEGPMRLETVAAPQYAAPEQFREDPTTAADVYATGLILLEMLLGRPLVDSTEPSECRVRHESAVIPSDVPASTPTLRAIEVALERAPEHRFADAQEMLQALESRSESPAATLLGPPSDADLVAARHEPKGAPAPGAGEVVGGKYRLQTVIGSGSFSQVYKGIHVDMDRPVAVKLLDLAGAVANAPLVSADELRERFRREARLVSKLTNPNTITLHDFGIDEQDRCYIVMEYLEGDDLAEALFREGVFEASRAARVARDILQSLSEAHHLGILHRDLKPGNIMLARDYEQREVVKVLDFGLATVTEVSSLAVRNESPMSATQEGVFMGTPQYAAPEQFLAQQLSPATDIYSVGLVLWEMMTGEPACDEDSIGLCLKAHLSGDPWRVTDPDEYPKELLDILYGALEKDPSKRYQSAAEMAADLDAWLSGRKKKFRPSKQTVEHWEPAFDYPRSLTPIGVVSPFLDDSPEVDEKAAGGEGTPHVTNETALPDSPSALDDFAMIDPNVQFDEEPEFLSNDAFYDPDAASEPVAPVQSRAERPLEPEPLELDDSAQRRGPSGREFADEAPASRSREIEPASRSGTIEREPPSNLPLVLLGLIVFVLMSAVLVYWNSRSESEPPTTVVKEVEPQPPVSSEPSPSGRFTNTMILEAVREAGWDAEPGDGSAQVSPDVYRNVYTLRSGRLILQMHLLVARDVTTANRLVAQTDPPAVAVRFDERVVRLIPPRSDSSGAAFRLSEDLARYRDEHQGPPL